MPAIFASGAMVESAMSSGIAETRASLLDLAEFWRAGGGDLYSNVSFACSRFPMTATKATKRREA